MDTIILGEKLTFSTTSKGFLKRFEETKKEVFDKDTLTPSKSLRRPHRKDSFTKRIKTQVLNGNLVDDGARRKR